MNSDDRLPFLQTELAALLASAERIASRGGERFFDASDDTQRLAAEAIVIRLADLVSWLPVAFTESHSAIEWERIRGMRNRLAHDYRRTDIRLVWAVIRDELPRLRKTLEEGPDRPVTNP